MHEVVDVAPGGIDAGRAWLRSVERSMQAGQRAPLAGLLGGNAPFDIFSLQKREFMLMDADVDNFGNRNIRVFH